MTRAGLFALVAEEAFRDGALDASEKTMLLVAARFLKLGAEEARDIALAAKARFKAGELGERRRLDPVKLYAEVERACLVDHQVDSLEDKMLAGLRRILGLETPVATEAGASPPGAGPAATAPDEFASWLARAVPTQVSRQVAWVEEAPALQQALAPAGRWDDLDRLHDALARLELRAKDVTTAGVARVLAEAVELGLGAARMPLVLRGLDGLHGLWRLAAGRAPLSSLLGALAATVEAFGPGSGRAARSPGLDPGLLLKALDRLDQVARLQGREPAVGATYAGVSGHALLALLALDDEPRVVRFLERLRRVARENEGRPEVQSALAAALVEVATARARTVRSRGLATAGDPLVFQLETTLLAISRMAPDAPELAESRRAFAGATGRGAIG